MSSSNADLPDPLEESPDTTGPSADDLLAQMADEEIDRLLDEAELERPPVVSKDEPAVAAATPVEQAATAEEAQPAAAARPAVDPVASRAAAHALDEETAAAIDDLLEKNAVAEAAAEAAGAAQATPAPQSRASVVHESKSAEVARRLDDLFMAPSESEPPAPTTAAAAAKAARTAAPVDPADQTGALERQVLTAEVLSAADGALETAEPKTAAADDEEDQRLPWYLRPLEWINAPVARCSQSARDLIGKAAIMTLVNALLVLIYVLFIRRH